MEKEQIKVDKHSVYHFFKRITDILVSLAALIVLSPVILILAILIFVQDGHNPFYRQIRIGQYGKPFGMFKFRSMIFNADKVLENNPKLYQKYVDNGFLNVLIGEMALVGPRPIVKKEMFEYGDQIGEFLSVKPGALGLWQASGRANIGYPERCDIELEYVRNASYWYDVKVFFACCISILKRDGAFQK